MTQASTPTPAAANFLNPEGMHRPTGYTHVVEVTAGRPVYIAGQIALDPAGELVGPGDIRAQAGQVFENLQTALRSVGTGFEQVVKLNLYLLDATQLPAVREVRDRYVDTAATGEHGRGGRPPGPGRPAPGDRGGGHPPVAREATRPAR